MNKIIFLTFLLSLFSNLHASEVIPNDHYMSSVLIHAALPIRQEGTNFIRSPYINRKGELVIVEGHGTTEVSTDERGQTITMPGLGGEIKIRKTPAEGRINTLTYSLKDETFVPGPEGKRTQYTDLQFTAEFDASGKINHLTSCESGDLSGMSLYSSEKRKCVTVSVSICQKFDEKRSLFADINRCSRIYRDVKNFYSQNVKDTQSLNMLKMISELGDHYDQNVTLEEPTGNLANNPFDDFALMQKIDSYCTFLKDNGLLSGGTQSTQIQVQAVETQDAD